MATYTAHVTQVIDGDTFWVKTATGQHKIRLDNIDTAERGLPGALAATNCQTQRRCDCEQYAGDDIGNFPKTHNGEMGRS